MRLFKHSILCLFLATSLHAADDFSIIVNTVGVGNVWRAGDVTAIHVGVSSSVNEVTSAWIQWEVPNADGDTIFWGRNVTIPPNGSTSTWLYAPTKVWDSNSTVWTVRLRAWEDQAPTTDLGFLSFSPQTVGALLARAPEGRIAIFGTRRLGLSSYLPLNPPEVKQEATIIASGLRSSDLPDSWPSLLGLDAIVWADTTPEFSYRQTQALTQWINRGGHFIISLPSIGDPWSLGLQNAPLSSLTGAIQPTIEDVPISFLRNILGRNNNNWIPMNLSVRIFGHVEDSWPSDVTPIMWLNDGRVIAIQRRIGTGGVTIIGIDLTSGRLASLGLPEADVFWNRILGRRSDAPSQNTIQLLQNKNRKSNSILANSTSIRFGDLISQQIAMSTTASGRLGTVFLLIISYWLLGGPIGFYILQRYKKKRWSWVLFTATAGIFSLGTWVFATSASGVIVPLRHVTVIDQVYGSNGQHAAGWFSIFLPTYEDTKIELVGEDNLLLPWTSLTATPPFVDHREIVMNLDKNSGVINQPARATTSNFSFDWVGGIEHSYYQPLIRITPNDAPDVQYDSSCKPTGLSGSIVNHMPVSLEDVTVIWVTDIQNDPPQFEVNDTFETLPWVTRQDSGKMLNETYMWRLPTWDSNETLQLSQYEAKQIYASRTFEFDRYRLDNQFQYYNTVTDSEWKTRLEMLSIYSHLKPPVYQKQANSQQSPESYNTSREGGRNLDFAEWFGRPCIIIMGFLPNAPIPVHITANGEEILQSDGITFMRWVYPLKQSP